MQRNRFHSPARIRAALAPVLFSIGLAACGGGGGSGPSTTLGFTTNSSSTAEGGTATVTLELRTVAGGLGNDVSVSLRDAGTGTAASGVDYLAIDDVIVTFLEGTADGATLDVDLTLLDDGVFEGDDETIALALVDVTKGVGLRQGGTHTLAIAEADRATLSFSLGELTTPDEGTATYDVSVSMALDPGDVLGVDLPVSVQASASGTATPGVDFELVTGASGVFSAGAPDGASFLVQVQVNDDAEAEANETAVLDLVPRVGGADLGTGQFVLTISEDDASPDPFLVAMGEDTPGGELGPLASGDARAFGTQSVNQGPGTPLRVELSNAGLTALVLSPLSLTGSTGDFRIEADLGAAPPGSGAAPPSPAPMPLQAAALGAPVGSLFAYDAALAASFAEREALILDGLTTPEGEVLTLLLARQPLPIADDALVLVDGVPLAGGLVALVGDLTLWSGTVVSAPDARVFLSFSSHGMNGWVRFGAGRGHETLHLTSSVDGRLVLMARDADRAAFAPDGGPAPCLGTVLPPGHPGLPPGPGQPNGGEESSTGLTLANVRLAVETDYPFYQLFGDESAAATYATELFGAVADAYERDVQATLEIAYLALYTGANDPWTAGDNGQGDTLDMLDELQDAYTMNGWPVQAELAHLISGADLGGGVAYLGTLCDQIFGFGVSANLHGLIDWGTFSGASGPLNWDFIVVAHELGHNFGAGHTHEYCPPLDACFSNCQTGTSCGRSTLMSYCHLCVGGVSNIDLRFHPFNADVMRDEIAASCVGDSSLAPGGTLAFDVFFDPTGSTGAKNATLAFTHDAVNAPSPFSLQLSGTASN